MLPSTMLLPTMPPTYYNAASASTAGVSSAAVPGMNGSMPMIPPHMQMPHIHNPKKRKVMRTAAGEVWEDPLLAEWDPNDFRLFCGDLGNDVTDEILTQAFSKYPSFQKARVVRDKRSSKSKGYGFVSFKTADDYTRAFKDMNGKYVGARPVKLRKSTWKDRSIDTKGKKQKK
ncbi:hypothetical protein BKA69DRAFT_1092600 [Paraphysoderma sedebokerense]|nr:hypothetical protein BKA69DRAFT_1092600 [Paraphysoderma sedebokerense]